MVLIDQAESALKQTTLRQNANNVSDPIDLMRNISDVIEYANRQIDRQIASLKIRWQPNKAEFHDYLQYNTG